MLADFLSCLKMLLAGVVSVGLGLAAGGLTLAIGVAAAQGYLTWFMAALCIVGIAIGASIMIAAIAAVVVSQNE